MSDIEEITITYLKTLKEKIKPNPNRYPIVDKWNQKYVWNPNKHMIFSFLRNVIDERMQEVINNGELFEQFCDVKQIPLGD